MSSIVLLKDRGQDKAGAVVSVPFNLGRELISKGVARYAQESDLQPRKPQAGLKELPKPARPQPRASAPPPAPEPAPAPPAEADKAAAAPESKEALPPPAPGQAQAAPGRKK